MWPPHGLVVTTPTITPVWVRLGDLHCISFSPSFPVIPLLSQSNTAIKCLLKNSYFCFLYKSLIGKVLRVPFISPSTAGWWHSLGVEPNLCCYCNFNTLLLVICNVSVFESDRCWEMQWVCYYSASTWFVFSCWGFFPPTAPGKI